MYGDNICVISSYHPFNSHFMKWSISVGTSHLCVEFHADDHLIDLALMTLQLSDGFRKFDLMPFFSHQVSREPILINVRLVMCTDGMKHTMYTVRYDAKNLSHQAQCVPVRIPTRIMKEVERWKSWWGRWRQQDRRWLASARKLTNVSHSRVSDRCHVPCGAWRSALAQWSSMSSEKTVGRLATSTGG